MDQRRRGAFAPHRTQQIKEDEKMTDLLEILKQDSPILNPEKGIPGVGSLNLNDPNTLRGLLNEVKGDPQFKEGTYRDRTGQTVPSKIPAAEAAIREIHADFKEYAQRRINMGHPEPKEMPEDMKERLDREKVYLELYQLEAKRLEEILAEIESREKVKTVGRVLQGGPRGSSKMRNGVLSMIDGQPVVKAKSGMLEIDCPDSPYHQVKVPDYFEQIVKPWLLKNAELMRAFRKKAAAGELKDPSRRAPKAPWPENPNSKMKRKTAA
jgi:hypothetical protein